MDSESCMLCVRICLLCIQVVNVSSSQFWRVCRHDESDLLSDLSSHTEYIHDISLTLDMNKMSVEESFMIISICFEAVNDLCDDIHLKVV